LSSVVDTKKERVEDEKERERQKKVLVGGAIKVKLRK
jgi:hypothetical protein